MNGGKKIFRLKHVVEVKGVEYKIIQVKKLSYEGKEVMGLHDHELKVISITTGLKASEKRQTFLHELFHAYLFECNIREGLDSQLEEVIVELLSQCMENHFSIRWKV